MSSEDYQNVVDLETKSNSSKPQKMSIKQYLASLPPAMRYPHIYPESVRNLEVSYVTDKLRSCTKFLVHSSNHK